MLERRLGMIQADVPLVPRHVLFGNPERLNPALSPDGRHLAWLAPAEGVLNVWVAPVDELEVAKVITSDRGRGIHSFAWTHQPSTILYLQDQDGDENWRLYGVDVVSATIRDFTPFSNVQARLIAVEKRHPERVLVALNRESPHLHDVYSLDLATGNLTMVVKNPGFVGWVVDIDLEVRAATATTPEGGTLLMVRDAGEDEWRGVLNAGAEDALTTLPLAFSADGSTLLAVSSVGVDTARLVRIHPATGEVLASVAGDPEVDVASVELNPDTREPEAVTFAKDRAEIVVLAPEIAGDMEALKGLAHGELRLAGRDDANRIWLIAHTPDNGPIVYHLWDRGTQTGRRLFSHRPALARYPLASMEPFSITARDGLTLHGYLTWPTTPAGVERARNLPAVLLVHGGPWTRDHWGFHPEVQWLANRGYLCIQVNFRGSAGYGKAFVNAGDREWGRRMHDDLIDTVEWAIEQGFADRSRVAIFGTSYGGYAALVGAAFTPSVFAAAVDVVGPSNLATLIRSVPPYWAPVIRQFHQRVGNPDTDEEFLWSRSPLSRVADITIPILIAQGANDPRVNQSESEQIVAALAAAGIDHHYLIFPDEGHGFVNPENRLRFYAAAEEFLARHLGGRAEP